MDELKIFKKSYLNLYDEWLKEDDDLDVDSPDCSKKEKRILFFIQEIVDLTTYNNELSIYFGLKIHEVMKIILKRENFEYIRNKDNYKNYIMCCNFIINMLDWGTSIRGAWLDQFIYCDEDLNINLPNVYFTEEIQNWLINEWLEGN